MIGPKLELIRDSLLWLEPEPMSGGWTAVVEGENGAIRIMRPTLRTTLEAAQAYLGIKNS